MKLNDVGYDCGNLVTQVTLNAENKKDKLLIQAIEFHLAGDNSKLEKLLGYDELKQKVLEKIESIEAMAEQLNIEKENLVVAFQQEINNLKQKVPNLLWVATFENDSLKQKIFPTFEDAESFMRCYGYTSHDKISKGVYRFRKRGKTNPETDYHTVHRVQVVHYG